MLYQHGDVLIEKVDSIPNDAERVVPSVRGHVLAEGEATGHYHAIKDTNTAEMYSMGNMLFMAVPEGKKATVTHEEHKPITVQPGDYKIRRVREYDHFEEEARQVRD